MAVKQVLVTLTVAVKWVSTVFWETLRKIWETTAP